MTREKRYCGWCLDIDPNDGTFNESMGVCDLCYILLKKQGMNNEK